MFCTKCGKEIDDNSTFCINCGESVNKQNNSSGDPFNNQYNQNGQFSGGQFNGGPYNGGQFNGQSYGQNQQPYRQPYAQPDAPSAGFAWLCFFFPLVGLILYIIWKDTYPLKAKSCGKGALIGVIIGFVFGVIVGILEALFLTNNGYVYYFINLLIQ